MIHPDFGCGTRCYRHDLLHKSLAVAASLTQLLASATTCYRHYMLQALPVTQVLGSYTRSDTTPVPPCRIRSKDLTIVWDLTCKVQRAMKHGEYCNTLGVHLLADGPTINKTCRVRCYNSVTKSERLRIRANFRNRMSFTKSVVSSQIGHLS